MIYVAKRKKDDSEETYMTEGIIFGLLLGTVLSIVININADALWAWGISPGIGMLLGIIVGMNIKKK